MKLETFVVGLVTALVLVALGFMFGTTVTAWNKTPISTTQQP